MDLEGKVAIVTGGARGLGKGFAEALLQRGAMVVIADVVPEGFHTVNEFNKEYGHAKSMFMKIDVTKEEELKRLFRLTKSQYGNIDVVVNNAGISNEDNCKLMIEINLVAVILSTQLALQYMNKGNGGRGGLVVNISSTAGLTGVPHEPVYSASKHGVVGYTRSVAARTFETTDQGIRVNCLCPSFTAAGMFYRNVMANLGPEEMKGFIGTVGIQKPERVTEAFMKVVDNPDNNGGIMHVTPKLMEYKFPRHLKGKL